MRKTIALLGATALGFAAAVTFAASAGGGAAPTGTGQPSVECDDGTPPGNAGEPHGSSPNLPGSPFVEGNSVSGTHYAGEQPGINDKNVHSVSQYDIACFRGPTTPPQPSH